MGDWASLAMLPALGEPFLFKKRKASGKEKPGSQKSWRPEESLFSF